MLAKNFNIKILFLVGILLLSYQETISQNLFCKQLGDDRLATSIAKRISNGVYKDVIKEDEFMFHNLSKHPVSFYYNGARIYLEADALSSAFKKPLPTSLSDCRVIIDGVPVDTYYNTLSYLEQDYENLPVSKKFPNDKTVAELTNDLDVYRKTLIRVQSIQDQMPSWFTTMKGVTFRIKQVNEWLKINNEWLDKKTSQAASSNNAVRPAVNSNGSGSTSANTSQASASNSNTSPSANGQTNNLSETQMREMELKRQLADLEKQQKQNQERSQAINSGIEGVANIFAQGIREDQARAAAREESNSLRRDKNAITGNFLLNQYKADADKGNETAISKVIEAYRLLDNVTEQKAFMHAMVDKYDSQVALGALTSYYNSKISTYKSTNSRYTRRGIFKLVFYTGIGVGLAHLGSEIDIYDEPERATEADVLTYSGGGMMILGVMAGLITMTKSGDRQEYNDAQQGLQRLQNRVKLSFNPKINPSRSYGMAVKLTF